VASFVDHLRTDDGLRHAFWIQEFIVRADISFPTLG
jgi:hypothetical protein